MTTAPALSPIGFTLRVPDGWFELDLWRATHSRHLARLVEGRVSADPGLADHGARLTRGLRRIVEDAVRAGAVYCAAMAEPFTGNELLLASCVVLRTRGPGATAPQTSERRGVDAIASAMTATGEAPGRAGTREVHLIDLPAGRAVRLCETAFLGTGRSAAEHVVMHTVLPTPGWSEGGDGGVLDVVLSSPQVRLAGPLLDLFDAVTATLRWLPASEESW